MSAKIWDVVQPTDNWERGYARLEYLRIGLVLVGRTKIPINEREDIPDEEGCCDNFPIEERCPDCIADHYDGLAQMQEDRYRDND